MKKRWWWYWFIDVDVMKSFFLLRLLLPTPHTMLNYWLEHNLMKKFFTLIHTQTKTHTEKINRIGWNISDSVIFLIHSLLFSYSNQAAINQNGNNMSNFLFYFLVLVFWLLLLRRISISNIIIIRKLTSNLTCIRYRIKTQSA